MNNRDFAVVICTRDRPQQLDRVLGALARQSGCGFPLVVVDHSVAVNDRLQRRADEDARLTYIWEQARGLSRARNLAWPRAEAEWVVLLDDDCMPDAGWADCLDRALRVHPSAEIVAGEIVGPHPGSGDYLPVTTFQVDEDRLVSGRWTRPWDIGFTAFCAVRRATVERLGGWDERLGAGAPTFPAGEDMDFNYRFLKGGGVAFTTRGVRVHHEQWRTPEELGPHFRGYAKGWSGFAMKHLRSGDVAGGLWLWGLGLLDVTRMLASALRRRSRLRLTVAGFKLQGLLSGTARGLFFPW